MFNPYSIIVGLFCVAGAVLAVYSGVNIRKKGRTATWPATKGHISESLEPSMETEFLPRVVYSYTVGGKEYTNVLPIPPGESSNPDFSGRFIAQNPVGKELTIYYSPEDPALSLLKVGVGTEDWVILLLGIGAMVMGLVFFVVFI